MIVAAAVHVVVVEAVVLDGEDKDKDQEKRKDGVLLVCVTFVLVPVARSARWLPNARARSV